MKQHKNYIAPDLEIVRIGINKEILDGEASVLIVSQPTDEQLAKPIYYTDLGSDPADSTLIKLVGDLPSAWHK